MDKNNLINNPLTITEDGTIKEDQLKNASEKINKKSTQIVKKIVKEENVQEIQNLTHLFNLNHAKKQVLRTMVYDDLLDGITDQMKERVKERSNNFSNKDLIDFMKTVTESMEKAQKQIGTIDATPVIQINQQNNYINNDAVGNLDRDSRQKVARLAQLILNKTKEGELLQDVPVYEDDNATLDDTIYLEDEIFEEDASIEKDNIDANSNLLNVEEDNL